MVIEKKQKNNNFQNDNNVLEALCKHLACQVAIGHGKCVRHGGGKTFFKNHQTLTSFCRHKEVVIIFFFNNLCD